MVEYTWVILTYLPVPRYDEYEEITRVTQWVQGK